MTIPEPPAPTGLVAPVVPPPPPPILTDTELIPVTSIILSEYPPAAPDSPWPLAPPPPPTSLILMYLTPLGLFQVPLPVKTCIPEKPSFLYSKALPAEFAERIVLLPPTLVSPVPPLLTGTVPVTTDDPKLTEPSASLFESTAPDAISLAVTVVAAIFDPVSVASINASPV